MNLLSHLLRSNHPSSLAGVLLGAWSTVPGAQFKEVKSLLAVSGWLRHSLLIQQYPPNPRRTRVIGLSLGTGGDVFGPPLGDRGVELHLEPVNTRNKRFASRTTGILCPWIVLSC
jgi:hypothetical protein